QAFCSRMRRIVLPSPRKPELACSSPATRTSASSSRSRGLRGASTGNLLTASRDSEQLSFTFQAAQEVGDRRCPSVHRQRSSKLVSNKIGLFVGYIPACREGSVNDGFTSLRFDQS